MNYNDQRRTYAAITRNGIAVLFACWLMGGANLLKKEIEFVTGLTDKPTADALGILAAEGYILHSKTGWSLTSGGRQMILSPETRNNSESISSINTESLETLLIMENNTNSESEIFRVADLKKALQAAKIGEPTLSSLLQLPGLTGLIVERWEAIKKGEFGDSYRPGALVNALRSLPGNPDVPDDPNDEIQTRRKYLTGKFSEFINGG